MADIKMYTDQIQSAVYGEEVRSSIINALNKVNDDNNSYNDLKTEVQQMHDQVEADYLAIQKIDTAVQAVAIAVETSATEASASSETAKEYSEQASETVEITKGYMDFAEIYKNEAKTYAEQAQAVVNIEIATIEKAGLVKPDGITLEVAEDGTLKAVKQTYSLTIPTEGWTAAAIGQYSYSLTLAVEGITENDIIDGTITLETEESAQNCNMAIQCWSSDGAITFYAESIPTAEMVFEYYILKGAE